MIASIFTHPFRILSGSDAETIPDAQWKYETLKVFAELSKYTACTEERTAVRDETLVNLGHLWRARNVGMPNMVVGETWDEVEKAFMEDMSAVLNDIKAVRNHGRTSLKRGHQQEKERDTTLEPQSGSKRHKIAHQVKSDDSPVSIGDEPIVAQVECCENEYASDVMSATSHVETVCQDWDLGSDSLCQQVSENAQIKRWKADTRSDQAAIKTLRDLSQIPIDNCEYGHVTCASLEEPGRCYLATGTTPDIAFAYKKLGGMYEVLEATANNARGYSLAVYSAGGNDVSGSNTSGGDSTIQQHVRRPDLIGRLEKVWGGRKLHEIIPNSMANVDEHGDPAKSWTPQALQQLVRIGEDGASVSYETADLQQLLYESYKERRENPEGPSNGYEVTVEVTQRVLDIIHGTPSVQEKSHEQSASSCKPLSEVTNVPSDLIDHPLPHQPDQTGEITRSGLDHQKSAASADLSLQSGITRTSASIAAPAATAPRSTRATTKASASDHGQAKSPPKGKSAKTIAKSTGRGRQPSIPKDHQTRPPKGSAPDPARSVEKAECRLTLAKLKFECALAKRRLHEAEVTSAQDGRDISFHDEGSEAIRVAESTVSEAKIRVEAACVELAELRCRMFEEQD